MNYHLAQVSFAPPLLVLQTASLSPPCNPLLEPVIWPLVSALSVKIKETRIKRLTISLPVYGLKLHLAEYILLVLATH